MTDFRRFPKLQHWIDEKLASGHYFCVDEVILDALWRFRASEMTPDECREELRAAIQIGIDQANRGELIDAEEVFAELRRRSTERSRCEPT